jgi:hypothetical protein
LTVYHLSSRLISGVDLEDTPIRQLSYSLTKTLFRISSAAPVLEVKAQEALLELLEKIRSAFSNSLQHQGYINTFRK